MLKPRRRGTALQELGKTLGGVLATLGMFAVCKTLGMADYDAPGVGEVIMYSSTYFGHSGDLFAPFPPEHQHGILVAGFAAVVLGTALRFKSYWRVYGNEDKD